VSKYSIVQLSEIIEAFAQNGALERAIPNLALLQRHLQSPEDYLKVLRLLDRFPIDDVLLLSEFRRIFAGILGGANQFERLQTLARETFEQIGEVASAPVFLEYARGLQAQHRHAEACEVLTHIQPLLHGEMRGRCWVNLAWSRFELKQPWEDAFSQGLPLLTGLEKARALINLGYFQSESGRPSEARLSWRTALPLVRHRASTTAHIRFNLGVSAQSELLPEAEEHFLSLEHLTRTPALRFRRAEALNGLGLHRRSLGEWTRASSAYNEALLFARETTDRRISLNGLARVHYLSGHPARALEVLEDALSDPTLDRSALLVTRALVLLALGDEHGASASLIAADGLHLDSVRWLAAIAEAEGLRRAGRADEAVARLDDLPVHGLHAREEAAMHPTLMRLLEDHGRVAPQPLSYPARTVVRVQARGALRVFVNARGVNIGAVGRVGELLVFLLEQGGSAGTEVIGGALYPEATRAAARKNVWALVKLLRRALGWEGSVLALRGAYQLDPSVTWEYDVAEARARGEFNGAFLSGVYSDWVLDVERDLSQRHTRVRADADLN
jgi:tetratricopeptide (TPR) repeat protein